MFALSYSVITPPAANSLKLEHNYPLPLRISPTEAPDICKVFLRAETVCVYYLQFVVVNLVLLQPACLPVGMTNGARGQLHLYLWLVLCVCMFCSFAYRLWSRRVLA